MIKLLWPSILLFGVVSFVFAGLIPAAPQGATLMRPSLPIVNGALFYKGRFALDNAALRAGAMYWAAAHFTMLRFQERQISRRAARSLLPIPTLQPVRANLFG